MEIMSADNALDAARKGRTLICFAQAEHLRTVELLISRYTITHSLCALRVDPLIIENAETLQQSRHPAFLLYYDGREEFNVVGADKLEEALRRNIR